MSFFKDVLHNVFPSKDDVQIWDCDPLLVVDEHGAVAFSKRTKVEWHPSDGGQGHLYCLTDRDDWKPDLEIEHKLVINAQVRPAQGGIGSRPGVTLFGHDEAGKGYTWYINGAADEYLTDDGGKPPPYDEDGEI